MRIGFVGPSYTAGSTAVADEEAINFFPQTVESQGAIVPVSLYGGKQATGIKSYFGTPGLSIFSKFTASPNNDNSPLRGQCWMGSRLFVVSGDTLYEVFADGTNTALSSVLWNDGKPVSMVASSIQLLIISAGYAYCYTLNPGNWAANTLFAVGALIVDAAGHVQRAQAAAWQASTAYTVGQEIVDPAGNVQQAQQARWAANAVYALGAEIVDPAGHAQKATQAQWVASTAYVLGAEIVDTNGNIQKAFAALWAANTAYALGAQIVDSNGNIQQVTTAGTTGATVPTWATSGPTADGSVIWTFQAASGGNAGTSGTTVPNWTTGVTLDNGTLIWISQGNAGGKAGTSGASIPTFNDSGGSVGDGTGTLVWADQGAATGAGTSGTAEPIFTTGMTPDSGTLVWVDQGPSNGSAGASGSAIPAFNDTGGTTLDGTGTLIWQDKGLQLLNVTSQLAGTPIKCEFSDSYFIVIFAGSNKFQMSQVLDGTTWPGTLVNEVEVFSENIASIIVNHREPWIMGSLRSQPYQDTGSLEVFDVIPGTLIEKGCAAVFSPCRVDNSVFWIDSDERGALSAWRSNGYTPTRISTYAVEYDLSTNPQSAIQGMTSYSYEDAGHIFWVLYIPGSSWSWCYDVTENLWHKRATWIDGGGGGGNSSTVTTNANAQLWELWSRPLEDNGAQVTWNNFSIPPGNALPSDAVIQGIYAVVVVGANFSAAIQNLNYSVGTSSHSYNNPFNSSPISPGHTFPTTLLYDTTSIGTSLSLLPTLAVNASIISSLFLDNLQDYMNITAVGFAIYYTSATPKIDPAMPPPFAVPAGQGLIWALPFTESDDQFATNGLVKIISSFVPSVAAVAVLGYDPTRPAKGPLFGIDPLTIGLLGLSGLIGLGGGLNNRYSPINITGAASGPPIYLGGPNQPPFTFLIPISGGSSPFTVENGLAITAVSSGSFKTGAVQGFPASQTTITIPPDPLTAAGTYGPHRSWNHSYAFGRHLVGDWGAGTLYQMSMANLSDNGTPIRRLRRSPPVSNEMQRIYHAELTVDFDTGLGPQPPLLDGAGNPRPPQAQLRFSDNRGKTWSNGKIAGCGLAGQYQTRVIYRRLGQSRYRVYELVVSDPIPWAIVDAYLRISAEGAQP